MNRKEWNKVYRELPDIPALKVPEPPCSHCRYWRPQPRVVMLKGAQVVQGIVLCHAEKMYRDFSCFEEPERSSEKNA